MRHTLVVVAGCMCLWSGLACAQFLDVAATDAAGATTSGAAATGPESPLSKDYLDLFLADARETATWPLQWDGDDWRTAGMIGGGLILTGAFLDKPIRHAAQHGRSDGSDKFFRNAQKFGTQRYGLPILAGFYGYGAFADDYEARTVALDGFSADMLSALLASTLKGAVGRARPNTGSGPHHFSPFQDDHSFPSGHATGAFAFASVIATHYDSPWVDVTAYGIAGLVGISRIRLDKHWMSDVAGGALIGGLIGHHVVEFNRNWRAQHEAAWAPTIETDGQQLLLTWRF